MSTLTESTTLNLEYYHLPPSCKFLLYILTRKGYMTRQQLTNESGLPERTAVFAIKMLVGQGFLAREDQRETQKRLANGKRLRKQDKRLSYFVVI